MDIITWQALVVHNVGGASAFVLFSGLSILPRRLTFSDLVVRAVAALYLRMRSKVGTIAYQYENEDENE